MVNDEIKLPEPARTDFDYGGQTVHWYTADQTRAAIIADRESRQPTARELDMAMLVKRLAVRLKRGSALIPAQAEMYNEAFDALRRLDLLGSVMRDEPPEAKPAPPRYVVLKASGSRYAFVNDTQQGKTVKRYDVFKGDGWGHPEKHAALLNAQDNAELGEGEA